MPASDVIAIADEIINCRRCPRLIEHINSIARTKRRAYKEWNYWGKPVPSFGDPSARLLIVGLAPAAHGANRTGRMFTGDDAGNWLVRALHRAGFANQPYSIHANDGLTLTDTYITAVCHCAPPGNKPTREEISRCTEFLSRELDLMDSVLVIVCLGQIAFDQILRLMRQRGYGWPVTVEQVMATPQQVGRLARPRKPQFRHGGEYCWTTINRQNNSSGVIRAPILIASYHPSRQNTNTGVLTADMFDAVFRRARMYLSLHFPSC